MPEDAPGSARALTEERSAAADCPLAMTPLSLGLHLPTAHKKDIRNHYLAVVTCHTQDPNACRPVQGQSACP